MDNRILIADALKKIGDSVEICGWVHRLRNLGGIQFIVVRDRSGQMQLVTDGDFSLPMESLICATGQMQSSEKAPGGAEMTLEKYNVLARANPDLPIPVNQDPSGLSLETILDNRMISLRNPKLLSIFRVQATCLKVFADFFRSEGFTEIKSSKIIGGGSEGGTNLFPWIILEKPPTWPSPHSCTSRPWFPPEWSGYLK